MDGQGRSGLERRRWYALLVVSTGTSVALFDDRIVAVALPAMGGPLHLSYSRGLWAQAAYLLVTSVLLIPAWRLGSEGGKIVPHGESAGNASASAFADGLRAAMLVGAALALAGAGLAWIAKPKEAGDAEDRGERVRRDRFPRLQLWTRGHERRGGAGGYPYVSGRGSYLA